MAELKKITIIPNTDALADILPKPKMVDITISVPVSEIDFSACHLDEGDVDLSGASWWGRELVEPHEGEHSLTLEEALVEERRGW